MTTALCIILDVGAHMAPNFEEAIECTKLFLQKKFFSDSKDLVALFLCGTQATQNHLADDDGNFEHISLASELATLNWDMLEFLEKPDLISTTSGDESNIRGLKNIRERRLLLITNLAGPIDCSQLDNIIQNLHQADVQLSLIGCDLQAHENGSNSQNGEQSPSDQSRPRHNEDLSEKLRPAMGSVSEIWRSLNGESYDFNDAVPALSMFETRAVSQRGWKVNLRIGNSLEIPVEGFTQVKEANPPSLKFLYAPNPTVSVRTITTYHKQDEASTELNSSDLVRGYRYGATLVPFGSEDLAAVKPNSEKCLDLISFTEARNVPRDLYMGDSVIVFVASSKSTSDDETVPPSTMALNALAQALYEMEGVALVRRVYNRVSAPRLGVLTPEIRDSQIALVYTDLTFADDVRNFEFPSLPLTVDSSSENLTLVPSTSQTKSQTKQDKHRPTPEQLKAMDQFINEMLLNESDESENDSADDENDGDRGETNHRGDGPTVDRPGLNIKLKPEHQPNPWIQRFFTCLRERGLHPTVPLAQSINRTLSSSTPASTSSNWLNPNLLPGLENLLAKLDDQSPECSATLKEARSGLIKVLPHLKSASDTQAEPSEASKAKRRKLMASELFGINATSTETSGTSQQQPTPSTSYSTQPLASSTLVASVGTVNPVQDFESLVAQNQIQLACDQMEQEIRRLVTDPFTGSLLRPRAVSCLYAYRKLAQSNSSSPEIAQNYNNMIRNWRQDLVERNLIEPEVKIEVCDDTDACLAFWFETISQGLGLISENEVPGIGPSAEEANEFMNLTDLIKPLPPKSESPPVETKPESPASCKLDSLLDDLE